HEVRIPAAAVDDAFVRNMSDLIRRLSAHTPPRQVPSVDECKFCDLKDCLERVEAREEELVTTEAFCYENKGRPSYAACGSSSTVTLSPIASSLRMSRARCAPTCRRSK